MSNLKQIGLGIMMYVQDNDGYFPEYGRPDSTTPDPIRFNASYLYWPNFIYPYIKSKEVFYCPSGYTAGSLDGAKYGANSYILVRTGWAHASQSLLTNASQTYMIMDFGAILADPAYVTSPVGGRYYLPGAGQFGITVGGSPLDTFYDFKSDFQSGRHFGGCNVSFADGHVKWLKSQTLLAEGRKSGSCYRVQASFPNEPCSPSQVWRYGHWDPGNP
jgi:prepilin-type processing-associated H-X9-DG protein